MYACILYILRIRLLNEFSYLTFGFFLLLFRSFHYIKVIKGHIEHRIAKNNVSLNLKRFSITY